MLEVKVYHKERKEINNASVMLHADSYGSVFSTVFNNTTPANYLTFDGKGVNLIDENLKFYNDGDYIGYTFSKCSNENCKIEVNFDDALILNNGIPQNNYFERLTIQFKDTCCSEIKVDYFDNNGMKQSSETITVNGKFVTIEFLKNYPVIAIYFTKTVVPYQYIRIESIVFGTINVFSKFTSHNLVEEINVLSDDLPINQFQATFVNPKHLPLEKNTPLTIFSSGRYYGTFYITDSQRSAKNLYDVTAQNVIGVLDSTPYVEWGCSESLLNEEIFKNIQNYSGISITPLDVLWETLNKYQYYYVAGDFKDPTCRWVLSAAGFALGYMIDSSRSDKISFIKIPNNVTSKIHNKDRRIIGDAILNKTDKISDAIIEYTWLSIGENIAPVEVVELSNLTAGNEYTYTSDKPVFFYTEEEYKQYFQEILYSNLYSICFIPSGSSVSFLCGSRNVVSHIETVINAAATIKNTKEFKQLKCTGYGAFYKGIDSITFERISRSDDVKKYITSKGKVKAKIRLRGEKVGNLIEIETAWDGKITGIITKMDITFGYEDIADIEVLEWSL